MARTQVFVSFDYDNDNFLKEALVGQSRLDDSPFEVVDQSIKVASPGWEDEARRRIRRSDLVAVMCGTQTHNAVGVAYEVTVAQEEGVPYFLLQGYADKTCTKPSTAKSGDKMYTWTWSNLKTLVGGGR